MLDIIIRNGTVIDGSGKAPLRADVGISGGRIHDIGNLASTKAKELIDAAGRYVVPGFVDITNHSDVTTVLFRDPSLESLARQGVTTIIGGNCGASLAPLVDPDIIHGLRKWSDEVLNVNWLSMAEYLEEVEKRKPALNFGTLVGHGTLRRGVLSEALRPMTLEELAKFKFMLGEAMDQGALGFSTNLGAAHEHHASPEEIIEIVKVIKLNQGVYKAHLRHEGTHLIPAVNEALRIGSEGEVPVSISHLKAAGRSSWPLMEQALDMINRASASGQEIIYDISPYARTGSQLHMLLPAWVREGGFHEMLSKLKDPAVRLNIIRELQFATLHFDRIRISEASDGISPGKTIAEIADRMGIDPNAALVELLLANRGRVSILGKTLQKKNIDRAILGKAAVVATNGSGYALDFPDHTSIPHPRSFGTFPHFLHSYVRDKKALTWEEAIRKISAIPAEFFGLKERGKIEKHFWADVVVFDPESIADRATYANPRRSPVGVDHVFVNGIPIVTGGSMTSLYPGKVIRRG